jgi:hypothetical protein
MRWEEGNERRVNKDLEGRSRSVWRWYCPDLRRDGGHNNVETGKSEAQSSLQRSTATLGRHRHSAITLVVNSAPVMQGVRPCDAVLHKNAILVQLCQSSLQQINQNVVVKYFFNSDREQLRLQSANNCMIIAYWFFRRYNKSGLQLIAKKRTYTKDQLDTCRPVYWEMKLR